MFNTAVGPDTNPPTVVSTTPANNATGAVIGANVTVTFDEALDPATVSGTTVQLLSSGSPVPASVSYDANSRTATLDPAASLSYTTPYTISVKGGSTDPRIKDMAGNALAANYTASFTTQGTPAPTGSSAFAQRRPRRSHPGHQLLGQPLQPLPRGDTAGRRPQ
ncbi:Ig-like domain-containing protein [Hymenobacter humi]|uniref:Ig-like domain-containing protein n=1 Tax=Hymenobacter humi TaxID=1411620 RepID=A0ABW2U9B5_9BACT